MALSLVLLGTRTRRAQVVASTMSCQRRLVEATVARSRGDFHAYE